MKYCESCRVKNNWPRPMQRAHIACDICGATTTCYDSPDHTLHDVEKYRK